MIGVLVNTSTVIIGSLIGLLFKKGIPERISKAVMKAIGLCTIYIGISGSLKGSNTIVLILSMIIGTIIGTALDIDGKLNKVGNAINTKVNKKSNGYSLVTEGFVTGSLLFCVGAMTIVGSLESGLTGNNQTIFTKSLLDFFSSLMLSVSLGIGVIFSSIFVFVFQGALVLLSGLLKPVLTDTAIAETTCAGSVIIIGLGLNLLEITKLKVANYLPALLFVPAFCTLWGFLNINI